MATDLTTRLDSLRAKTHVLVERYALLEAERKRLESLLAERDAAIERCNRQIAGLQSRLEYLSAATTLTPSRDDVDALRAMIAGLVREIDKCILDLTD